MILMQTQILFRIIKNGTKTFIKGNASIRTYIKVLWDQLDITLIISNSYSQYFFTIKSIILIHIEN